MWDIFFSFFVITALALLFSHAWNMFANALIATWEIKDAEGNVKDPIIQSLTYAIVMTLLCICVLVVIHYYTDINLAKGRQLDHRNDYMPNNLPNRQQTPKPELSSKPELVK